ncbi:hypothetical protein PV458_27120 [Streptomyces sp. MN03-5084-2B]|nr:hypothetical protein [Streptomyces sp. MN03-5084-2B]
MELLRNLVITVGLAIFTGGLQLILKGISRTNLPGKKHGLTKDDSLFWSDWIIAACLALGGSLLVGAIEGRPVPPLRLVLSLLFLSLGCSAFPLLLRLYAYENGARLKEWGYKGMGGVLVANGVGMLVLLSAVYAGVSIYDFK